MRERLAEELKRAMKGGDKPRVAALRLVNAALKDKDIEARGRGQTVGEEDVMALLQKMLKSRQESLGIYEKAGREDLAVTERSEIAVIGEFLPQPMDAAATAAAIEAAVADTGATGMKDMGRVIARLRATCAGRMDFAAASPLVKARLTP